MGEQVSSLMILITLLRLGTPLGATKWNSSWESSSYNGQKKLYNVNNDFIYIMSNAHRFKSCNSLWIITLWTITGFWIYILLCLLLENFPFCIKHYTLIVRTLSVRQTPLSWELFSSRKNLTLPLDICGDLREGMGGDTTWVGLTTGEASLVGGETEQSFSLSRKSTGLRRIMGSYNTKERLPPHHS